MMKQAHAVIWPPTKKPFLVRGKITFALGVEAEDARDASDRVRNALDKLVGVAAEDFKLPPIIHEWEVLTEQIERSE